MTTDSLPDIIAARRKPLTISEFAEILGVAPTTIYDRVRDGRIKCYRIGSAIRLDPKTTADWLRKQEC